MTRRSANATIIAAVIATGAAAFYPAPAEAARCKKGYIYRPSQGVCQHRASYIKQTRVRHNRYRVKRERPVKKTPVIRAKAAPAVTVAPTPMWYFMEPNPFKLPYGRLVVMLQNYDPNLALWASMRLWNVEE